MPSPRGCMPMRTRRKYSFSNAGSPTGAGVLRSSHCFIAGGVDGSAIKSAAAMRVSWMCSLLLQADTFAPHPSRTSSTEMRFVRMPQRIHDGGLTRPRSASSNAGVHHFATEARLGRFATRRFDGGDDVDFVARAVLPCPRLVLRADVVRPSPSPASRDAFSFAALAMISWSIF